jgi:hypothetical protein
MSDSLAVIQQNKITELRNSLADALDFTEVQQARIEQLETAIKRATEYGEVSFLGVNIPFENFKLLKEALENKGE